MREIFDRLKPGEIVLIEYSSRVDPLVVFVEAMKWARVKGYQILITDLFNRVDLCLRQMKIGRFEPEALKDVKVIEIGYHKPADVDVVKFISGDRELPVLLSEYGEIYEKIVNKKFTIVFLFGIERYVILRNEAVQLVSVLGTFLGDIRRIAFYFVNRDVLANISPNPLTMLEELASTIIELKKERGKTKLFISKAFAPELDGREFMI